MSYSEVKTAIGEVQVQCSDLSMRWVEHQRQKYRKTQVWACTHCPDRKIFPSEPLLWEHIQFHKSQKLDIEEDLLILLKHEELLLRWQWLRFLGLLLRRLLQFLINCSRFGGYPNRRRPKCTTMPWTIWPSLVVLWGVCWMFVVPWSDVNHFDAYLEDSVGEEQAWPFSPSFSLGPDLASMLPGYNQFLDNHGSCDAQFRPDSILSPNSNSYDFNFGLARNPSELDLLAPPPSAQTNDKSARTALDVAWSSNDLTQLKRIGQGMVDDYIGHSRPASPQPQEQKALNINNDQLSPRPSATLIPSGSQPQVAGQLLIASTVAPQQPESPPRNAEGKFICVGFGCSDQKIFKIRSDWQTHVNQHRRPYTCSVEDCSYRSATKGVLVRHMHLKHSLVRFESPDLFHVSGREHCKGVDSAVLASISSHGDHAVIDKAKGKGKRQYTDDEDEGRMIEVEGQTNDSKISQKNAKQVKRRCTLREEEPSEEIRGLRQELARLREELSICRAERDEEKKEREKLLNIFDRVTKQMK